MRINFGFIFKQRIGWCPLTTDLSILSKSIQCYFRNNTFRWHCTKSIVPKNVRVSTFLAAFLWTNISIIFPQRQFFDQKINEQIFFCKNYTNFSWFYCFWINYAWRKFWHISRWVTRIYPHINGKFVQGMTSFRCTQEGGHVLEIYIIIPIRKWQDWSSPKRKAI